MSDSLRIGSQWSSENTATALLMGFPGSSTVQSPSAVQELQEALVQPLGREGPLERGMAPTPVFLPGEPHGQRS